MNNNLPANGAGSLEMRVYLFRVFGTRVFIGYGLVALLSVLILAALDLVSQYGLHAYAADQIHRIPWDITLVHRAETHRFSELRRKYLAIPGVQASELVGFLRLRNLAPLNVEVDGKPSETRWLGFIAATRADLLPEELQPSHKGSGEDDESQASSLQAAILVSTPQTMTRGQRLKVSYGLKRGEEGEHTHDEEVSEGLSSQVLFDDIVGKSPSRMERQEFNKWMLREIGSLSYLPDNAIVALVSIETFEHLAALFHRFYFTTEGVHEGSEAPQYLPEVTHLVSVEREGLVSAWDLAGSVRRVREPVQELFAEGRELTPFSYVNSDLLLLLGKMEGMARLVGLATLLIAIPFLWMGWVLARTVGRLLILNERRLIGLALVRGIPIEDIERSLLYALVLGGVSGGVLGLGVGTMLPLVGYRLMGEAIAPWEVLLHEMAYFGIFLGLGVIMAVLSGREVLRYVKQLTPREAVARVEGGEERKLGRRGGRWLEVTYAGVMVIGGYKIVGWMAGGSLLLRLGEWMEWEWEAGGDGVIWVVENLLNFVALPLFLFGLAGWVMLRMDWVQKGLTTMTAPLVGELGWFVSRHMTLGRHRIANLFFVAALAMSLSLLPQIASDGFYGRVLRGVRTSVGGDVLLDFDLTRLIGGQLEARPIAEYEQRLGPELRRIGSWIQGQTGVERAEVIEQYFIPGIYMPGQSGLALNVVQEPEGYLKLVHYEEQLGVSRGFSEIVRGLQEGRVAASQGLFQIRSIPHEADEAVLDYWSHDRAIQVPLKDVMAYLPGQPSLGIANREGFVTAEIDYLNYLQHSDARIVVGRETASRGELGGLEVVPSRVVFVVKGKEGWEAEDLAGRLGRALPIQPEEVRWEGSETKRLSKDMFLSLAMENMKVYMLGGVLLALASVGAIALVNFATDRRTFGLLRLRGMPLGMLLRISISIFLIPVIGGVLVGVMLGGVSGYGVSEAVWELPRVYGAAGSLSNRLVFSRASVGIVLGLSLVFSAIAAGFGFWLFRKTAREVIRER